MTPNLVTIDWLVLAPVLAPALGALVVLLADALAPRARGAHLVIARQHHHRSVIAQRGHCLLHRVAST